MMLGGVIMPRAVYFSVDLHGHVNPTLGLIKSLVDRGVEIYYYSCEKFRHRIEDTGAIFRSYEGLLGFGTYDGHGLDTFLVFADFILSKSQIIVTHFMEEIRDLEPNYIIHDSFCHWGKVFAELLGVPGISVIANFPYIDEMADIDPTFFMQHVVRASDDPICRRFNNPKEIYSNLMHKLARIIEHKYGMQEINIINDVFCSKEELNILFTSRCFQLHADAFSDQYLFAGYSIYPRVEHVDFPYEKLDPNKPLIYIAFGTIYNELLHIYKSCFEAFKNSEQQVVLSVGDKIDLNDLGEIPNHFIVRSYVPQLEILKRSSVFISHGGANSIYESICFHVPLVVVPQVFDEFMGAMMVEEAGAGIYIRNREADAVQLREGVKRILNDSQYKLNCKRIHESFVDTGGIANAVDEIINYTSKFSIISQ